MFFLNNILNNFIIIFYKIKNWDLAKATKWSIYFFIIGLVAGLGSVVFNYMCKFGIYFFLNFIAGYYPSVPYGEVHRLSSDLGILNKWILLLLPAFGGFLSGFLVYSFAPEAEGHGTDAAIDAYHNKGGRIRFRVPIIKTLASSITLTTGGSGGREGPIAQIGAGFGSFLGSKLNLSDRERRIMMAAGIAAGVGSIFRAPLAGALFAAEVLYKDTEFESEVIISAGIASVIAYCIFCLFFGWGSLFNAPFFNFSQPIELLAYFFLSITLVFFSFIYVKVFYGIVNFFKYFKLLPDYLKPALGGLFTGIIGFYVKDALAFGYGYIQKAIYNEFSILTLIIVALARILTTSFSIGSGGSGGVFGPSIVIGGSIGGAVGIFFCEIMSSVVFQSGSFVIVGMAGFFTAVSNTPISTIIFVSEMTNSYQLLLPSLMVCSITYALSKKWTIFNKQVKRRMDSPAHLGNFFIDILDSITVKDVMFKIERVTPILQNMSLLEFKRYFSNSSQKYYPVIDHSNRLSGIFSIGDIRAILFNIDLESLVLMGDIGSVNLITTNPKEKLSTVFKKFSVKNIDSLPVVTEKNKKILIGMINRRDIIDIYNKEIETMKMKKVY